MKLKYTVKSVGTPRRIPEFKEGDVVRFEHVGEIYTGIIISSNDDDSEIVDFDGVYHDSVETRHTYLLRQLQPAVFEHAP